MMYVDVPLVMTHESPRKKPEQYVHEKQALACERLLFYFPDRKQRRAHLKTTLLSVCPGGGALPSIITAKAA